MLPGACSCVGSTRWSRSGSRHPAECRACDRRKISKRGARFAVALEDRDEERSGLVEESSAEARVFPESMGRVLGGLWSWPRPRVPAGTVRPDSAIKSIGSALTRDVIVGALATNSRLRSRVWGTVQTAWGRRPRLPGRRPFACGSLEHGSGAALRSLVLWSTRTNGTSPVMVLTSRGSRSARARSGPGSGAGTSAAGPVHPRSRRMTRRARERGRDRPVRALRRGVPGAGTGRRRVCRRPAKSSPGAKPVRRAARAARRGRHDRCVPGRR